MDVTVIIRAGRDAIECEIERLRKELAAMPKSERCTRRIIRDRLSWLRAARV